MTTSTAERIGKCVCGATLYRTRGFAKEGDRKASTESLRCRSGCANPKLQESQNDKHKSR